MITQKPANPTELPRPTAPRSDAHASNWPRDSRPGVVLDTNAVLDWLAFRDPSSHAFAAAITAERVVWWVDLPSRQELAHVLARGVGAERHPDLASLWDTWDRHGEPLRVEASALSACLPRCTDPDDQKFIELAVAGRARWLITRDRALLRLARAARRWQLQIVTPERFSLETPE